MSELTIITNNVPREIIDGWQLTADERAQFDYIDWPAIEEGRDSASFFRYRGELYDLSDFLIDGVPAGWSAVATDSYFSGTLVRLIDDESVVVGRYYS